MNISHLSHESISRRAQELWQQRGTPDGQDVSIWLDAEQEIRRRVDRPTGSIDYDRIKRRLDAFGNNTSSRSPTSITFT
ncbi:MAG: hypothetical protein JWM88_2210 [Verrucomicrobia bacterium]|nr:hypothetical protein [Verrucomicrobiota bacterium]